MVAVTGMPSAVGLWAGIPGVGESRRHMNTTLFRRTGECKGCCIGGKSWKEEVVAC